MPVAALVPNATEFVPFAMELTPHPNEDASADAPLLLTVSELTTDVDAAVTSVRMGAVVTATLLTKSALVGATLVIAPVEGVVRVVAFVKKLFRSGAVTAVTTCCDVGVPLTMGTVSSVTIPPGGVG